MDLLKDTVDHAADRFDALLKARFEQLDRILDEKIDRAQKVINGLRITNTTAFDTPEVERATPNVGPAASRTS